MAHFRDFFQPDFFLFFFADILCYDLCLLFAFWQIPFIEHPCSSGKLADFLTQFDNGSWWVRAML
jgi:hypothetical protein